MPLPIGPRQSREEIQAHLGGRDRGALSLSPPFCELTRVAPILRTIGRSADVGGSRGTYRITGA